MCVYDCERYEVFTAKRRTAAKEHRCYECYRTIYPGERYERADGLYDGRWDSMATCPHCIEGRRFLDVLCSGAWSYGDVWEQTYDHIDELDCGLGASLFVYELEPRTGIDLAEEEAERRAQIAGAWSHEGACVARLVSARKRWADMSPMDVRELASTAIEAWRTVEPA